MRRHHIQNKQFMVELPLPVARELEDLAAHEGINVEELMRNIVVSDVLDLAFLPSELADDRAED